MNAELEAQVKAALGKIEHPTYKESLDSLGMFGSLAEESDHLKLVVKTPDADRKVQIGLEAQIRGVLQTVTADKKFKIKFEVDESLKPEDIGNRIRGIKNIIAVGSGKGGVGKSTVSANLAAAMVKRGFKVGLMDADIYGPSQGRLFGLEGKQNLESDGKNKIKPLEVNGLKLMSFAFMLNTDQAVVWRGPMLGKAVEQFLYEITWGELDYLIIDLPPGTGDVQLSLAQLVEVDGAIIVTTPQNVALQDASRAASMFQEVKVPVLGVIENMSEFQCPKCGTVTHIFSKNGGEALAAKYKIPKLGGIPISADIMDSGESGKPIVWKEPEGIVAKSYNEIIDKVAIEIQKYR